jgi:Flp pilus assembly protein TadB
MCADTPLDDVRELWSSQATGTFRLSPDDVHARMERYNRRSRRAAFDGFLASAFIISIFIGFMALFQNPLLRAGAILVIASYGFLAWESRSSRMAEKEAARLAAEMGTTDAVAFYREQLRRQQQRHAGSRFWRRWLILLPGPIVFFFGFVQARPDLSAMIWVEAITFIIAIAAAIPVNRRIVRQCQRQIDELDQLRKEIS